MAALVKINGESIDLPAAIRLTILDNGTFLREAFRRAVMRVALMEQLVTKLIADATIEYRVFEEQTVRTV